MKSYEQRQKEWVQKNDLKIGDKVKVLRKAKSYEGGWNNSWCLYMDSTVGKEFVVNGFNDDDCGWGISLVGVCDYPYFVLEPVDKAFKLKA